MESFSSIPELKSRLRSLKKAGKKTGFVPTMGALHEGHTSLIGRALSETGLCVCSIFVNPLQFNDKKDLEKYPRTPEADREMLEKAGCHVLFTPSAEEIYPHGQPARSGISLGGLDKPMEGAARPGHFEGVAVVVKRLFEIVEPTHAYFGEKDFQQLAVIRFMSKALFPGLRIVGCDTMREPDGLAMSSRNALLSPAERKEAALLYKVLTGARSMRTGAGVREVREWVQKTVAQHPLFSLEYFEIVDADTLLSVQEWGGAQRLRACIAARIGNVRLIDNMSI